MHLGRYKFVVLLPGKSGSRVMLIFHQQGRTDQRDHLDDISSCGS